MATQEQHDLRKKWVDALRSGKYKQGKGYLHSKDDTFCCLGVLCDVAGVPSTETGECFVYSLDGGKSRSLAMLSDDIRPLVGLRNPLGGILERSESLAVLYDDGKSFNEIADVIESAPPGLFVD
jgi:hypothetical protein